MSISVAFLLGAGASAPYGVPMMAGFYAAFKEHVARHHPTCAQLLQKFEAAQGSAGPDLETLMSDIQAVLGMKSGFDRIGEEPGAVENQIALAQELRGYLDAFIVDTCERLDRPRVARQYANLLKLKSLGPLWFFTTNYDRVVELACEMNGVPYSDGFANSGDQAVAEWRGIFDAPTRVVKLHGSVNWYVDETGKVPIRLDRGYSLPTHEFRLVRRNQSLRQLMIIPTLEKEALGNPYIALATTFTDVLRSTRLLVIAGSSLRDPHVREYINVRMDGLRVLLVGPSASANREVFRNPLRTHVLDAGFAEFLTLGHEAFVKLVEALADSDPKDDADSAAVERFIASVAADVADEGALIAEPELAQSWRESRMAGVSARVRAIRELELHPHPIVIKRVTQMAQADVADSVRVAAVGALFKLAGAAARPTIGDLLRKDRSQEVQMEAALALVQLPTTGAVLDEMRSAIQRTDLSAAARAIVEEGLRNTSIG